MGKWLGVFMLEVKGISFRYQYDPWLFRNLNLSVKPGEVVGLFGCSGSGKTTMAQIITGYKKSCKGEIIVDGNAYFHSKQHPVQLIWQHPEKVINPKWRMKEILTEAGISDTALITALGIKGEWLKRLPSELSGGELQRFCIVRALGSTTKYLIADEMTTMLDAITQAQIWRAVLKLAKQRKIGVLAISHDPHLLRRVSDRVIEFNELID